jgi:hypothetical protein
VDQSSQFQDSLHAMLMWFLDPRSAVLDSEGDHRPRALASHLSCCYRQMGALRPAGVPVVKSPSRFDVDAYLSDDRDFRRCIVDLCSHLRRLEGEFIVQFYLHGSMATLDYEKGWSDVDTFMVVKQEVVTDERRLNLLRQHCVEAWPLVLAIAPLQHHGFIVVTEEDLACYPSHYLPLPVLDHALSVLDGPAPVFRLRPVSNGSFGSLTDRRDALAEAVHTGVLKHHPKKGVCLQGGFRNADDAMAQLHALLDYLMLVPAVFLDAIGEPCYKRESFARARPYFSAQAWSIIDRATQIRRAWPVAEGQRYICNAVPIWLQQMLGPHYFEDGLRLLDEAVFHASPSVRA